MKFTKIVLYSSIMYGVMYGFVLFANAVFTKRHLKIRVLVSIVNHFSANRNYMEVRHLLKITNL